MSKRPTQPDDWSRQSEALFRAASTEHAPTAVDRARVRRALAHRLVGSSTAPAAGNDTQATRAGTGTSAATFGKLVKIGLGVACVMAGAVALMRGGEAPKSRVPTPHAAQKSDAASPRSVGTAPLTAAEAAHTPQTVRALEGASPAPKNEGGSAVASAPQRLPAARDAATATRVRSTATKLPASVASTHLEPQDVPATQAPRSEAQPSSAEARSATPAGATVSSATTEDSIDARAELAFMARINAAMVESRTSAVLALCAEHARRWPDGTFAQEREGLRAIASCSSRASDGGARARRFLASYPRSSLAPRVRDECASLLPRE